MRPWQLRNDALRVDDELLEFARLFFVDDGNPAFVVGTSILWVDVRLNPSVVALDDGTLVSHPGPLRVLVGGNRAGLIRLDILREHGPLVVIGRILHGLLQVEVHFS